MKPFIPAIVLCSLLSLSAAAQPQARVSITSATVFLSGAELAGNAKISLPQGESDVLFTNIAGDVSQQSLTIGAGSGVVVQSATFQNNYLGDSVLSPRAKVLRDSISFLEKESEQTEDRKAVLDEQLAVLKENHKVNGANTSLSVVELQKLLDLLNTRMNVLLTEQRTLTTITDKADTRIALLKKQLDEEQRRNYQPGGQLLVKFYAPQATATTINMSYVVPNAGWTPSYDVRVDAVNAPVKLFYKANVFQNSGVKWDKIHISLSTGNPYQGVDAPVLNPVYLSFYQPSRAVYGGISQIATGSAQIYQSNNGGSVSIGGGRNTTGTQIVVDGIVLPKAQQQATLNHYTTVDNSGVNTTFDIDLPYTVPSDGQQHTVAVKTYELPATYRHFAVPRMDRDAFLQAQVTHWEDLNLLPAQTNVFFEGAYVGQGYIDMRSVKDTMNLSLGRDKKIIIRRERDQNVHSVKTIGTNERQAVAYTISIRNTRKEAVHLVVMDELPVSNDKDIVIEDPAYDDAAYEESTGALRWTLDVPPSETKKVHLSYTVKYPRGKTVSNLQ